MPLVKINYKSLYYKDWSPKDGTKTRATLLMVSITSG